jgi:hypothetical protein
MNLVESWALEKRTPDRVHMTTVNELQSRRGMAKLVLLVVGFFIAL